MPGNGRIDIQGTLPETPDLVTSSCGYAQRFSGQVGRWFLEVQKNAVLRFLSAHPVDTILDVGGGHGQLAEALITQHYKVTVLGSSKECPIHIQSLVSERRCTYATGNLLNLPYPDRSFDVVVSIRQLGHIENWDLFISELCRVASTAVLIDYPKVCYPHYFIPFFFRLKKMMEKNTRPYTCLRETELLRAFKKSDFHISARFPQFAVPMVLHRMMQFPRLSAISEAALRSLGITELFGSPVILRAERRGGESKISPE